MLRRILLSNLKAFKGDHGVALAPLTLIYGSNSSGKSSLIQSLLLLKQTLDTSDPEQPALVIRGNLVDLGSVPGILTNHDTSLPLRIGVDLSAGRRIYFHDRRTASADIGVLFTFEWDDESRAVRQKEVTLSVGENAIATFTRRRGPQRRPRPAADKTAVEEAIFRIGRRKAREQFVRWATEVAASRQMRSPQLSLLGGRADDERLIEQLVARVTFAAGAWGIFPAFPNFLLRDERETDADRELAEIVREVERTWSGYANAFQYELSNAMEALVYLGPLRRPPERFHVLSGARRTNVGREGEFTAELLSRRPDLIDDVNEWLRKLEIPYTLDALSVGDPAIRHSMGDVVVVVLTDTRSGLRVSPGDVGFGISQLLPIVVQTLIGSDTTVCIEQPEIHVHPALQARMADLFVEAVSERRRNQLIVETHSEHLMLRIQKRVRVGDLSPQDVAVLYVDVDAEGNSYLVPIPLDEDGAFLRPWPHGFFEERFEEVFLGRS